MCTGEYDFIVEIEKKLLGPKDHLMKCSQLIYKELLKQLWNLDSLMSNKKSCASNRFRVIIAYSSSETTVLKFE